MVAHVALALFIALFALKMVWWSCVAFVLHYWRGTTWFWCSLGAVCYWASRKIRLLRVRIRGLKYHV
jgi:hypothetical protein